MFKLKFESYPSHIFLIWRLIPLPQVQGLFVTKIKKRKLEFFFIQLVYFSLINLMTHNKYFTGLSKHFLFLLENFYKKIVLIEKKSKNLSKLVDFFFKRMNLLAIFLKNKLIQLKQHYKTKNIIHNKERKKIINCCLQHMLHHQKQFLLTGQQSRPAIFFFLSHLDPNIP